MAKRPTFEQACAQYVHRFTMEHVPAWARQAHNGRFYAPQFVSDREWYDRTIFPGEAGYLGSHGDAYTTGQTWPFGQWLATPYHKGMAAPGVTLAKPTYDELLQMLDNVSASLANTVLAHGASMSDPDRIARAKLASDARTVCDALLREGD